MRPDDTPPRLVTEASLAAFFQASVDRAIHNQQMTAGEATIAYLTRLLTDYSRADRLFLLTREGPTLLPLAELYSQALQAGSERERRLLLQRLGDVALFVAGLFSDWLGRRLVGVDYYCSMGEAAYGYLSEPANEHPRTRIPSSVFAELSRQFARFVDVLAEVGEQAPGRTDRNVLRLYDRWRRTGSPRLERALRVLGVTPVRTSLAH
jgi:hypothetical protein